MTRTPNQLRLLRVLRLEVESHFHTERIALALGPGGWVHWVEAGGGGSGCSMSVVGGGAWDSDECAAKQDC